MKGWARLHFSVAGVEVFVGVAEGLGNGEGGRSGNPVPGAGHWRRSSVRRRTSCRVDTDFGEGESHGWAERRGFEWQEVD